MKLILGVLMGAIMAQILIACENGSERLTDLESSKQVYAPGKNIGYPCDNPQMVPIVTADSEDDSVRDIDTSQRFVVEEISPMPEPSESFEPFDVELYGAVRAKKNKRKNKSKSRKRLVRRRRRRTRAHIFCSSHDDLYVYRNTWYLGAIHSWKTYFHKVIRVRRGDVILVKVNTRGPNRYGAICSIAVRVRFRIRKKGKGYRYEHRYRYYSTGVSNRWKVSRGYEFGQGKDTLRNLIGICKNRRRWKLPYEIAMKRGKCPHYPYKDTRAKYTWEKSSMNRKLVYLRYVHGRVICKSRKRRKPKKPMKSKKPIKQPKPYKPNEQCECEPVKRTMSYCYQWTDETKKLCDSRPCEQKYKCIGPPKRGKLNCISRPVVWIIVPKYPGAKKCKYEETGGDTRHVVPYDFPEGLETKYPH